MAGDRQILATISSLPEVEGHRCCMPDRHAVQPGKYFSAARKKPKLGSVMLIEQHATSDVS
jgi:hypothetical protein